MSMGERIRSARKMARMSQDELAHRAGVTKQSVSKYEREDATPGSRVLLAMADALGVSVEFFLRPRPMPELGQLAYRKHRSKLSRADEREIEEKVREWLERYLDLEDLVPTEWRQAYELPQGWPRQVRASGDIEEAAIALRREWLLGLDPLESVVDTLEARGIRVFFVDAPAGFDGLTFRATGECSPVIVVSQNAPGDRQRFSMLHELGHLALDFDGVDPEKAAHRFAAAFLLPQPTALNEFGGRRQLLDVRELALLKLKYGLSMQALVRRARDLGVITQGAFLRACREFSARGWRKREPGPALPPEAPKRMKQLAAKGLAEGFVSKARAAELMGQELSEFTIELAPDEPASAATHD